MFASSANRTSESPHICKGTQKSTGFWIDYNAIHGYLYYSYRQHTGQNNSDVHRIYIIRL